MLSSRTNMIWIFSIFTIVSTSHHSITDDSEAADSVCTYGSSIAVNSNPQLAACPGTWEGHIANAVSLCAAGWHVCSSKDRDILQTINWQHARNVSGCYAIDAVHIGGSCRPCSAHTSSDEPVALAGIGNMCPHQNQRKPSCIGEGRIDAAYCSDPTCTQSNLCTYKPGIGGVLCCKPVGVPPRIIIRPEALTHVVSGVTFVLSCQAMGDPSPKIQWFKNNQPIPKDDSRIREFDSGYLLLSEATPQDSGVYQCVVTNVAGAATTDAKVLVTDYTSGCADGSSDGLAQYETVHACKGTWTGHVKRGRNLCAKGWHVCSPRHESYLKMLTVTDITGTDGCFAYNAMNTGEGCTRRCHRDSMAGIGKECGRWRKGHQSCLTQGRMDVLKGNVENYCSYEEGLTTGVLCCKRPKKSNNYVTDWEHVVSCTPRCENAGICVGTNQCQCRHGYKGAWCQHPICTGGCIPNSYCIKPGVCRCRSGFTFNGDKCTRRRPLCGHACFNGGLCKHGHCKCPHFYYGKMCQYGGPHAIIIDQDTGQVHLPHGPRIEQSNLQTIESNEIRGEHRTSLDKIDSLGMDFI